MLHLDHLTVVAPTLAEGVAHVRACLGLDVPFGQRHGYMGAHNHLLQLGGSRYLEIVAIDPSGEPPPCARWFGLDDAHAVRADWDAGRRLRGWVARTDAIDRALDGREAVFGRKVSLPWDAPLFEFTLHADGSLPLDGAAPSLIDRRGRPRSLANIADLGARLVGFTLEHPEPEPIAALFDELGIEGAPLLRHGARPSFEATISTPSGLRRLT